MVGIEYHPLNGDPDQIAIFKESGDGGNRTRVQKIRPTEIYERSRLTVSPPKVQSAKPNGGHSLRPEGPLSRLA
jgi:hypothetical protein